VLASYESAAGYFDNNTFLDAALKAFTIGGVGSLTYAFEKRHVIGRNRTLAASSSTFTAGATVSDFSITTGLSTAQDGGPIVSGTWTPTLSLGTNAESADAYLCMYLRVSSVVHVAGRIRINPVTTGDTVVWATPPIPSDFTNGLDVAGVFNGNTTAEGGAINANVAGNTLQFRYVATSTAATVFYFTASYRVL
jgi:hypothetical protein